MLRRIFSLTRPTGIALAIFILLNVALALQDPTASATRVWLNVPMPEPLLSIFSGLLGLVLILPHDVGKVGWARWLLGGIVFGFCILVGGNVVGYYHRLGVGEFTTSLPVPFSVFPLGILLAEFARISWWGPVEPKLPPPAWCFVNGALIVVSFFVLILLHIVTFGHTDYRRPADAAVILGAKVYDDGRLCDALERRMETGVELFDQGYVRYLIMSGGTGPNGLSEPEHMARYAQEHGVPLDRILLDPEGRTTRLSARNCRVIAEDYGFRELLTVTQYFHCARVKLIFEREGMPCFTVPTGSLVGGGRLLRGNFYLLREALAYPFYLLYHR